MYTVVLLGVGYSGNTSVKVIIFNGGPPSYLSSADKVVGTFSTKEQAEACAAQWRLKYPNG